MFDKNSFFFLQFSILTLLFLTTYGEKNEGKSSTATLVKQWTITEMKPSSLITLLELKPKEFELQIVVNYIDCPEKLLVTGESSVTNNTFDALQIIATVGPDEFLIQLEGKVLLSYNPTYFGCGRYIQTFPLNLEGVYHLSVVRLRTDYLAVANLQEAPPTQYEEIIREWMLLKPSKEKEKTNQRDCLYDENRSGAWTIEENSFLMQNNAFQNFSFLRSVYPLHSFFNHYGLGRMQIPIYLPLETPQLSCLARNLTYYSWRTTEGNECTHNNTRLYSSSPSSQEIFDIFQTHRLLFVGDSHMRVLINHLLQKFCSIQENLHKFEHFDKEPNYRSILRSHPHCKNFQISYQRNLLFEPIPALNATKDRPDFLILNWGHHPAAYAHYSFAQYAEGIHQQLTQIYKAGFRSEQIIWIESIPFPLQVTRYYILYRDLRTFDRIRVMNRIAKPIMEQRKIAYIPTFHYLLPFSNRICDFAHYFPKRLHDPIIDHLLQQLRKED